MILIGFLSEQGRFNKLLAFLSYPAVMINHEIQNIFSKYDWLVKSHDLNQKNQQLKDMLYDAQAQNIALQASAVFWQNQQELIDFSARYNFDNKILAQVFLSNLSPQQHYFLLDKGALDGVQVGMVAIYKNCLLGKVDQVHANYCQLTLLTDRTCKIAVYNEKTKSQGICCGNNNTQELLLSYVSHLEQLQIDDLLISNGIGEIFPEGFAVGRVSSYQIAGMYYIAHASLMFNLADIKSCYLVAANKAAV